MLGINRRAATYTYSAAMVLLLLYLVYLVRSTLFVFVLALLFAYLLSPLVNLLDRFLPGRTRTPALALAYVIFIGVGGFSDYSDRHYRSGAGYCPDEEVTATCCRVGSSRRRSATPGMNSLKGELVGRARSRDGEAIQRSGFRPTAIWFEFLTVASELIYVVIIPILAFFFLKDGKGMRAHILEIVDRGPRRESCSMKSWRISTCCWPITCVRCSGLSLAAFTAYSIFFSIMGVPYGVLLAAIAGMLEFIPMSVRWLRRHRSRGSRCWRRSCAGDLDLPDDFSRDAGLHSLSPLDGQRRRIAPAADLIRRLRGRRNRRHRGNLSLRPSIGVGADSLPALAQIAAHDAHGLNPPDRPARLPPAAHAPASYFQRVRSGAMRCINSSTKPRGIAAKSEGGKENENQITHSRIDGRRRGDGWPRVFFGFGFGAPAPVPDLCCASRARRDGLHASRARTRIFVDRGLLRPGWTAMGLARRILGATALCWRTFRSASLSRRKVLRRLLAPVSVRSLRA